MCDAGMDEQFLLRFGVQTLARSNECKKIGLVHTALLSAPQKSLRLPSHILILEDSPYEYRYVCPERCTKCAVVARNPQTARLSDLHSGAAVASLVWVNREPGGVGWCREKSGGEIHRETCEFLRIACQISHICPSMMMHNF